MRTSYAPFARADKEMVSNLSEYRLNAGLTIAELCKGASVAPGTYCALNNGMKSPLLKNGGVAADALKLADFFQADPVDIWPDYFCELTKRYHTWDVFDEVHGGMLSPELVQSPEDVLIEQEREAKYAAAWSFAWGRLTPKERICLTHLLDDTYSITLEGIAEEYGVTRERVRQMESKALNRLKWSLHFFKKRLDPPPANVEYVQPEPVVVPPKVRKNAKKNGPAPPKPPKYRPPTKAELKRRQYANKVRAELAADIVAGRFRDNPREMRWALAKIKRIERSVK